MCILDSDNLYPKLDVVGAKLYRDFKYVLVDVVILFFNALKIP